MPHYTDARIIARKGALEVLATSQELCLRDATLFKLHFVNKGGIPDRFLRALVGDMAGTFVVDLRELHNEIDGGMRMLPERDWIGLVDYHLRTRYLTSIALRSAVIEASSVHIRNNLDTLAQVPCLLPQAA